MTDFDITSKELARALGISQNKLYDICKFFDDDDGDDWDLVENVHFVFGAYKARVFSYEGALEICSYLEAEKKSILVKFKDILEEWLTGRKRRLKGLCIAK